MSVAALGQHHLLYIPDGHRRYAASRSVTVAESLDRTARKLADLVEWCSRNSTINMLSLLLLTEYNLERYNSGGILTKAVLDCTRYICEAQGRKPDGCKVRAVGELETFFSHYKSDPSDLLTQLEKTSGNTGLPVNLLIAYNGEKEIARLVNSGLKSGVKIDQLKFNKQSPLPPVTVLIRSGQPDGVNRASTYFIGADQARWFSFPTLAPESTTSEVAAIVTKLASIHDSWSSGDGDIDLSGCA